MGVDYRANFGLAIKVELSDKLRADICENKDSEYYTDGDILCFLDYFIQESSYDTQLQYFEVGTSSYTGGENDIYIKIVAADNNPFDEYLPELAERVKKYLLEEGVVKADSKFLIQGGLHIY